MSAADARDRAIVGRAGPGWFNTTRWNLPEIQRRGATRSNRLNDDGTDAVVIAERVAQAAARILNRIVREEAKRGKGRR